MLPVAALDLGDTGRWAIPVAILLFGVVAMGICYAVLRHHDDYWMSEAIAIMSIPVIVTGVLFVVTMNWSEAMTKEVIGVLAALVGFIGGYAAPKKRRGD